MILTCYALITLLTFTDEVWNAHNPRPEPQGIYYCVKWEKKDFYSYKIKGEWVLRKKRKTDSPLKRRIRARYWKKRLA